MARPIFSHRDRITELNSRLANPLVWWYITLLPYVGYIYTKWAVVSKDISMCCWRPGIEESTVRGHPTLFLCRVHLLGIAIKPILLGYYPSCTPHSILIIILWRETWGLSKRATTTIVQSRYVSWPISRDAVREATPSTRTLSWIHRYYAFRLYTLLMMKDEWDQPRSVYVQPPARIVAYLSRSI